jgi:large subunit ribosomal protein L25
MIEQQELAGASRTTMGKANKRLRKQGWIPGTITRHNQEPQPVQVAVVGFDHLRRSHAATGLIRLIMLDAPVRTVLIGHVQRDPLSHLPEMR